MEESIRELKEQLDKYQKTQMGVLDLIIGELESIVQKLRKFREIAGEDIL